MIVKCSKCKKKYETFEVGSYNYPYVCSKCSKKYFNIFFLMIISLILMIPLISSQQVFKQNDLIDIKIQCIINGTYCSAGAGCNITLNYPNNSILLNSRPMTNQHAFYNYTLNDTSTLGDYPCSVTCCDVGYCGTNQDCSFEITADGTNVSVGQSIIYVSGLVFAFVIFLMLLYASIAIPFKNTRADDGKIISVNHLKWLKIGAICLSYVSLLFIFGLATAITRNFLPTIGMTKFFEWLYIILLSLSLPLAILAMVLGFSIFINDYVVKKKLKRRHWR